MIFGPLIVAAGMALLALSGPDASYFRDYLPGLLLFGIGMALVIAPLTKSALSVEPRFSGSASGINNAIARTAGLMAVALLGAIVVSAFTAHLENTISLSGLAQEEKVQILEQSDRLGAIIIPPDFDETALSFTRNVIKESFIYGFRWAMFVSASLAIVGSLVSFLVIHRQKKRSRTTE
jgi:hypothetical protein